MKILTKKTYHKLLISVTEDEYNELLNTYYKMQEAQIDGIENPHYIADIDYVVTKNGMEALVKATEYADDKEN